MLERKNRRRILEPTAMDLMQSHFVQPSTINLFSAAFLGLMSTGVILGGSEFLKGGNIQKPSGSR